MPSACPPQAGSLDRTAQQLWAKGSPLPDFLDEAGDDRTAWLVSHIKGAPPDEHVARVERAGGPWRLLVIAEAWCSDSAETVPLLARLADRAGNLDMRVVRGKRGRALMEAYRTPDGRAATPTVVLLDAQGHIAGTWVERPVPLQRFILQEQQRLGKDETRRQVARWYERDGGRTAREEVVALIERAGARTRLGRQQPGTGRRAN